ncbi:MAG: OmpA family protein [Polyangiales bacterium]
MRRAPLTAAALAVASLAPTAARAQWHARVEGFGVVPLAGWQSDAYVAGGGVSVGGEWAIGSRFGLTGNLGFAGLVASDDAQAGGAIPPLSGGGYGWAELGARLRPLGYCPTRGNERLWVEVDGGFGLTGRVIAPSVRARVGYAFAAGPVDLGPFVGWSWMPQTDAMAYPGDAHLASLGLSLTLHPHRPEPAPPLPPPPPPPEPPPPPQCPVIVGATVPDANGDGCPEPDRDGDQVHDLIDRCPDAPEDHDGFEDEDGCPDPDNDRDGIPDATDRCPNEPEVVNGVDDQDGCPDQGVVEVREGRIVIEEQVFFDTNSYRIRARSEAVLDAIARILRDLPPSRVVIIEGHADHRGDDRYNFLLSFLRSVAVQRELIARHARPNRLRPLGFGRRVPRAQGTTSEALAANRRVEIVVSGVGSVGVAQTIGGWVRVEADGTIHRLPGPPP